MRYGAMNAAQQGSTLYRAARPAVEQAGFTVAKAEKTGGAQVVNLARGGTIRRTCIRTSRNRWFAFVPLDGGGWKTLDDAEDVMVATVDNFDNPQNLELYLFPANVVRERLNEAYAARRSAGHTIQLGGFGVWLNLDPDTNKPYDVGSGLAAEFPAIIVLPLTEFVSLEADEDVVIEQIEAVSEEPPGSKPQASQPATIADVLQWAREQIGRISGMGPDAVKLELTLYG